MIGESDQQRETESPGLVVIDQAAVVRGWNSSAERLFGHPANAIVGSPLERVIPERKRPIFREAIAANAPTDPERCTATTRIALHADGHEFPVEIALGSVCAGNEQLYIAAVRDAMEDGQRAQLQLAFRAAALHGWHWDIERDRLSWDRPPEALLGPPLDSGGYPPFPSMVHGDDRERFLAAGQAVIEHGGDYEVEFRIVANDGRVRWAEAHGRGLVNDEGVCTRIVGVTRDVTRRHEEIDRLRDRERLARQSQRIARICSWEWDPQSRRLVAWSSNFAEFHRIPEGEIADRVVDPEREIALVHPDDRARYRAALAALHGDGAPMDVEYRLYTAAGELRAVREVAEAVHDGEGRVVKLLGTLQDITERKADEAQRNALQREVELGRRMDAVGQLAGGVAHEFNNLLAVILGYGSLIRRDLGAGQDPRLEARLTEIERAGERGRELVSSLLAFSRAPHGTGDMCAIVPAVEETLALASAVLPSTLAVVSHIDPGLARHTEVALAAVQVHQVLINLCINAREAIGGSGRVDVALHRAAIGDGRCASCGARLHGGWIELAVADDGPGLDPEAVDRVFEPFFTTKPLGQGNGMGLAVVHGIVHESGGHLRVQSTPGRGSCFAVLLPEAEGRAAAAPATAAAADAAPEPAAGGSTPALDGAGSSILVAEDDDALRAYLIDLLSGAGYRVIACADGDGALATFERDPGAIDLVVTDQTMPGVSGADLAGRLLAVRPGLPIVVCTGFSERLDEEQAGRLGIAAYLEKPFTSQVLLEHVAALLGGERS